MSYGSYGTTEAGMNVGGSLNKKFDFDFAGTFFNRASDYKIGKNNWLRNSFGWKNSVITASDGEILETDDSVYDGAYMEPSKMQYFSSMLRLGYKINDQWRVDVMGENYTTTKLNTLGDMRVLKNDKGERLYNTGEVVISGKINKHHLLAKAYVSNEKSKTFIFLDAKQQRIPEYLSYQSSVSFWAKNVKEYNPNARQKDPAKQGKAGKQKVQGYKMIEEKVIQHDEVNKKGAEKQKGVEWFVPLILGMMLGAMSLGGIQRYYAQRYIA